MGLNFIKSNEKHIFEEKLNKQLGITSIPFLLTKAGKEKIRGFSGNLSKEEIQSIEESVHVEFLGLYIIKEENELRLSPDAAHLLKDQITKNKIELNESQVKSWMQGNDLQLSGYTGLVILTFEGLIVGCGKSNNQIIFNFLPKDRRTRKSS